jgi:hypothetical protein
MRELEVEPVQKQLAEKLAVVRDEPLQKTYG